jgi:microcompartment protein CcmL/EutN
LIADHAVVSNQTNSQHNVIAAADKLVKSGANVTILGTSYVVTSASITSDGKTGKLL